MMRLLVFLFIASVLLGEVPKDADYNKHLKVYFKYYESDETKRIYKAWYESGELKEESVENLKTGEIIAKNYTKEGYLESIIERDKNGKRTIKDFSDKIPQKKPWREKKK